MPKGKLISFWDARYFTLTISLDTLLEAFRDDIQKRIINIELFLIALIPFMRGYASIVNRKDLFETLTQVMHGYKTGKVDIAKIFIELFGNKHGKIVETYSVDVNDILGKNADPAEIVDNAFFPLLNKTLNHSFIYLYLRLSIEKSLTDKFVIDTERYKQLGQIISAAYPDDSDKDQVRARIRLTSNKTLINEFNHFEGNLSIFQPAIDITDKILISEKADILSFIEELNG